MTEARLKAQVIVQAAIRRASMRGIAATVARRGDPDAGAVYVKVNRGPDIGCTVLAPTRDYEREVTFWRRATGDDPVPEADADAFIERERRIEGAAGEAKRLRRGAAEKADLIDARMRDAQEEARKILQSLREKGMAKERAIVEDARAAAQGRIDDARADLFAVTEEVRGTLRDDARALADDIVAKMLNRAV